MSRAELARLLEAADAARVLPEVTAELAVRQVTPGARLPVGARLLVGAGDRGGWQPGEAGLAWTPGWNLAAEAGAQAARGPWWAAVTVRARVRTGWGAGAAAAEATAGAPLSWPGWDPATGPAQARRALLLGDGAELDAVRAVVGHQAGGWSASLGWEPRRHGPGLGAALLVDRDGPPFAALTVRRTEPWRWPGALRPLGPQALLLRAGLLSARMVGAANGEAAREDRPWFFQWLVRWRLTDWARLGFTHAAMAAPRSGTLWPDLLRINFPPPGVTWDEQAGGPFTDRLFSAQLEFRWRRAPWRLLPRAAGRAWWEYAGEDFLPRGPAGLLPEIAAPASVAGVELVDARWDLAFEYAETLHPLVLWYANGSFPSGWEHEGSLLGASLGGAGERFGGLARWRGSGRVELEFGHAASEWGAEGHTPHLARERHTWLQVAPLRGGVPGPWRARLDGRRGEALPPGGGVRRHWWALSLARRF
ncbi:capsule assembly Wzi family protein [bacterium]|nr:capsule assembly Wzi family protein [bacterium]